ncbi:MAG TPA: phosphotransferase [Allosphingosinicella sp.]|nr:phosphotransferase [Allosphingosinicella sp.]
MRLLTRPWQELLPERLHDAVQGAITATYGRSKVQCLGIVMGGVSAVALPIQAGLHTHLLRVETQRHARNPHQYACMAIAADAGIAPALHFADETARIAIMDYVDSVPLHQFPGGGIALARALGAMAARLQATPAFPVHDDYRANVRKMLAYMETCFEPGLLDRHKEGFDQLGLLMPWDSGGHVSSHNDLQPGNLLFDGERLWLVDWETACRNDPLVDVAVLADNLAATPDLAEALMQSWLGRPATVDDIRRLAQMTVLTRLHHAGSMILSAGAPAERMSSLEAPTQADFETMVARRALDPAGPEARLVRGRMYLAGFVAGLDDVVRESKARGLQRRP